MFFLVLYVVSWLLVLGAYAFHASTSIYPFGDELVAIAFLSVTLMAAGYALGMLVGQAIGGFGANMDRISVIKVARVHNYCIGLGIILIVCLVGNYVIDGPPPVFALFGIPAKSYIDYGAGAFTGPISPTLNMLFLSASWLESRRWRWLMRTLVLLCYLGYMLRGPLFFLLAQVGFLWLFRLMESWRSLRTARTLILVAVIATVALTPVFGLLDNLRGSSAAGAIAYLKVAPGYRDWPLSAVLVILYFSLPASNLLWIMNSHLSGVNGIAAFSALLPRIVRGAEPFAVWQIPGVIDHASTFMAPMYLGLGWPGLIVEHLVLGFVCYVLSRRVFLRDRTLYSSKFAVQIVFCLFDDVFQQLIAITQYALTFLFYRYCTAVMARNPVAPLEPVPSP